MKNCCNWFNKEGRQEYMSVLYVPLTKNSELALKEQNNQGREFRVKVVERSGETVKQILANKQPCGLDDCF